MNTTTTEPRELALGLLQSIDRHGAYTDAASAAEDRDPCTLPEAIRAAATVVEGAMPAGNVPPELAELFSSLAMWAWDEGHKRYATGAQHVATAYGGCGRFDGYPIH
jgi:hypothetical protein